MTEAEARAALHPGGITDPHGVNALVADLRQRTEAAEARTRELAGELAAQHERAGRLEGERDAALVVAARLREDVAAERERGNAALERALAAEAKLEAGGDPRARER